MFIREENLLSYEQQAFIDKVIAFGDFSGGTVTAVCPLKAIKKNSQMNIVKHHLRDEFFRMNRSEINNHSLVGSLVLLGFFQDGS
jgi:hypothetical protein